jgi:hypothetical protein
MPGLMNSWALISTLVFPWTINRTKQLNRPFVICDLGIWLNLVERWFAELTTKWIKRGAHRSVRDLVASIRTWITNWNDNPKPFVWHKSADQILDSLSAYCQRINDSRH